MRLVSGVVPGIDSSGSAGIGASEGDGGLGIGLIYQPVVAYTATAYAPIAIDRAGDPLNPSYAQQEVVAKDRLSGRLGADAGIAILICVHSANR
jgi:hypothetical protein